MSHNQVMKVSLDGGVTYVDALEGVRVIYEDVIVDEDENLGALHVNLTSEGIIMDVYAEDDSNALAPLGTSCAMLDDIVSNLCQATA